MSSPVRLSPAVNLVHYWWPVVTVWSLTFVVGHSIGHGESSAGLCALLLGTLAAYSFDRLTDARRLASPWLFLLLLLAALASAAGTVRLLPLLPRSRVALLVGLSAVSLLYPVLKRVPWLKAALVAATWTIATCVLPWGWSALRSPIVPPMFLLVAAGCLLCDLKDVREDAANGVASVPVRLGVERTIRIALGLALAVSALAARMNRPGLELGGLALAVLAPWRRWLSSSVLGSLAVDLFLTIPGLVVALRFP